MFVFSPGMQDNMNLYVTNVETKSIAELAGIKVR
jgi:hypothetical protein